MKGGMKTISACKNRGLVNYISSAKKRQKSTSSLRPSDTCSSQAIRCGGVSEVGLNARKSAMEEI